MKSARIQTETDYAPFCLGILVRRLLNCLIARYTGKRADFLLLNSPVVDFPNSFLIPIISTKEKEDESSARKISEFTYYETIV